MKTSSMHQRSRPMSQGFSATNILVMGLTFLLLCAHSTVGVGQVDDTASASSPFVDPATLDPKIPTPSSVIGHEVGDKAVRYDSLMRYLEALAASSDRIVIKPYGKTYEGRTLVHLYITSPANHKRLDQIRENNGKLADPRKLANAAEGKKIVENSPATAVMAYSIHGDELSSTDAAMQAAYQLAAGTDAETMKLLEQVVTIMDPLQNPDGRERHLASIEQRMGAISSPDGQHIQHGAINGRTNHYRFDMNRDWVSLVSIENQARMKVVTAWNPHFMVDSHEMGPLEGYLMDPPRQPLNPIHPTRNLHWRQQYGFDQAAAFDEHGWSYYAKDWNVEFAPIYTTSWINLSGGAGLLYEQAGVNSAAYKQQTGHLLTFRETVHHQLVGTLANLHTLKNNRSEILGDYLADHQDAVKGEGELTQTFLMPPHADRTRMARFVDLLDRQSIEYSFAQAPFKATGVTDIWGHKKAVVELPAGTLVVKSAQPFRRMVHAFLGFDTRPDREYLKIEREELENHGGSRFYDVTAWNLPMSFGLESYWAEEIPDVEVTDTPPAGKKEVVDFSSKPKYGYIVDFSNAAVYDVLVRLFDQECHPRVATKPFDLDGHRYKPGTVVLRGHENPDNLGEILKKLSGEFDVDIRPAQTASVGKVGPDLGGPKFLLLHAPRVAIAAGSLSNSAGAVWHLLDYRLKMRVSPLDGLNDLRKYNVLVLPGSGSVSEGIKKWVANGGTLIAFDGATRSIATEGSEISSVRRRRDVLDKLAMYREDLDREQRADDVEIDFDDLWGDKTSVKEKEDRDSKNKEKEKKDENSAPSGDLKKLQRIDEWQRIFRPSGVFVKAKIDERQWLGFGLGDYLPVMIGGDSVLMSMHPTETPVRLVKEEDLRLGGLLWPEARQRFANSAFATVERHGRGQVILFASNPTHRGWYPGTERLFLNAVLLGPGMGTRQSLPW